MKSVSDILIILLSITVSSMAHVFLKKGISTVDVGSYHQLLLVNKGVMLITRPWIICGLVMYGAALVLWMWALSRVDVSYAYPFLALGIVLVGVVAHFWMGEELSIGRIIGSIVIMIGIFIVSNGG